MTFLLWPCHKEDWQLLGERNNALGHVNFLNFQFSNIGGVQNRVLKIINHDHKLDH